MSNQHPTSKKLCIVCECSDGDHYDWCTPQAREQRSSKELVARLRARRDVVDHSANNGTRTIDAPEIELQAADEIERLQHELEGSQTTVLQLEEAFRALLERCLPYIDSLANLSMIEITGSKKLRDEIKAIVEQK